MKLLALFLIIIAFPVFSRPHDTIEVKLSTLEKASKAGITIFSFKSGECIKIIRDSAADVAGNDVWGLDEKEKIGKQASCLPARFTHGFTPQGDYSLAKESVEPGVIPEVSFSPSWERHKMVDEGQYYVFHSGEKIFGRQAYRFFIRGKQLPQPSSVTQWDDAVIDDGGKCFFYSLPLPAGLR
ncbi:MAG: hypothetical protein PHE24_04930 [Patescibacteria group bacterium]|nr:hypothetical protein [Patescibacteria group bacterium]